MKLVFEVSGTTYVASVRKSGRVMRVKKMIKTRSPLGYIYYRFDTVRNYQPIIDQVNLDEIISRHTD